MYYAASLQFTLFGYHLGVQANIFQSLRFRHVKNSSIYLLFVVYLMTLSQYLRLYSMK
jgi:hypothetical protein